MASKKKQSGKKTKKPKRKTEDSDASLVVSRRKAAAASADSSDGAKSAKSDSASKKPRRRDSSDSASEKAVVRAGKPQGKMLVLKKSPSREDSPSPTKTLAKARDASQSQASPNRARSESPKPARVAKASRAKKGKAARAKSSSSGRSASSKEKEGKKTKARKKSSSPASSRQSPSAPRKSSGARGKSSKRNKGKAKRDSSSSSSKSRPKKKPRKARSSSSSDSKSRRKKEREKGKNAKNNRKDKAKRQAKTKKKRRHSKKRHRSKSKGRHAKVPKGGPSNAAQDAQKQMRLAQLAYAHHHYMHQMGMPGYGMPPFGPVGAMPPPPGGMPPPPFGMPPSMLPPASHSSMLAGHLPGLPHGMPTGCFGGSAQAEAKAPIAATKPKAKSDSSSSSSSDSELEGAVHINGACANVVLQPTLSKPDDIPAVSLASDQVVPAQTPVASKTGEEGPEAVVKVEAAKKVEAADNSDSSSTSSSDSDSSDAKVGAEAKEALPGVGGLDTLAEQPIAGTAPVPAGDAPVTTESEPRPPRRRRTFDPSPSRAVIRHVETVTVGTLPQPVPTLQWTHVDNTSEVEAFLLLNEVDQQAAIQLRTLAPHLQRQVLDKCDLSSARNKSAVLLARIRDAKADVPAPAQQAPAAPPDAGDGASADFVRAVSEEVSVFCQLNSIDPDAATQLKAMAPELQLQVLERGDLSHARNPSAVLIARMRDAKSGISHQDGHGMPAPAPTGESHAGVEFLISTFRLDARCALMLRSLPRHKQDQAAAMDLTLARRPSAYVMSKLTSGFFTDVTIPSTLTVPAFGVVGSSQQSL